MTAKGKTWVLGASTASCRWKRAATASIQRCRTATARLTSSADSSSPRSISQTISGLSWARRVGSACRGASSSAFHPRQTRNACHSSEKSKAGTSSSTTQPSSARTFAAPRPSSRTPGSTARWPPRSPTHASPRPPDATLTEAAAAHVDGADVVAAGVGVEGASGAVGGVGHHRQQRGHVVDGPAHRTQLDELHDRTVGCDGARGRAEAQHVAERRGVAQRTHVVAAVGDRQHPGRERGRSSPAAAADRAFEVVGVAGDAVDRVVGLGAEAELGCVRLADDHQTRRTQPRDDGLVDSAHPVAEDR